MAAPRQRIDLLLVELGLAESRAQAQALVMAGAVVAGEARIDKPGQLVDPALPIRLKADAAPQKYASRGALKLEKALEVFPVSPAGLTCADLGASTGGFTDLLLQRGAARVYAVDVGYGQLHPKLRGDPRVVVRERENARALTAETLGERVALVTADLSFISLRLVLPAVKAILQPGGHALLLVKPQFEVGKGEVGKGGVVRDDAKRRAALDAVAAAARDLGFEVMGHAESPIQGPAGNREWLLGLRAPGRASRSGRGRPAAALPSRFPMPTPGAPMPIEPASEVAPGVLLVDTGYVRPRLAACYVVRGEKSAAVVETGHAAAVPRILAALDQAGIDRRAVSHVVITHVHLDHAGGAGALMQALPQATLVAHPRGARHMIDPAKLWAGTVGVYGAEVTQRLYGDPIAVPAARVVEAPDGFALDLGGRPLRFLDAPGHARHHLVVFDEVTRGFFTGDAFGLSYRQDDSAAGPFFFPTTTPVQLDPPAFHATLDRMLAERPERVYLTHYGCVTGRLAEHAATLHRRLDELVAIAKGAPAGQGRHAAVKQGLSGLLLAGLAAHGAPRSRAELLDWYDNDLDLDAQGLEVWLDGTVKG